MLVCVTEDSLRDNSYVRREISYALLVDEKRKKNGDERGLPVIPVLFEDLIPHLPIVNNDWVVHYQNSGAANKRILEIVGGAEYANLKGNQSHDPFRPYLVNLYDRIVDYLDQVIIREIDLATEPSPEAVPEWRKPVQHDMLNLMFSPHHEPTKEKPEDEPETFNSFAEAFAHYDGQVLLLGQPGAGKTITLYANTRDAIAARLDDPAKPLPLFGIIPGWDSREQTPLVDWIAQGYSDLETDAARQVVRNGNALLLLDGLDELGSEKSVDPKNTKGETYDPRKRFIEGLSAIKNNQVLVTCRIKDYDEIGKQADLNGAVTLQPMSDAQIAEYLKEQPELWELVQSDTQLREIVETPLLLSIFGFAYRDMTDEEKTHLTQLKNAGDLRDKIFLTYIEKRYRHEERKVALAGETLPYTLEELLDILGQLAMEDSGGFLSGIFENNVLDVYNFANVMEHSLIDDFVTIATRLHILVPYEGKDVEAPTFRFTHLNLRDTLGYAFCLSHLYDPAFYREFDFVVSSSGIFRSTPALALGRIGGKRAVKPLIETLMHGRDPVREHAAESLGLLGDALAINPLINSLDDENATVRANAASSLGWLEHKHLVQHQSPRVIEALIRTLNDPAIFVRKNAVSALGQIGALQAVESLIAILVDPQNYSSSLREEIIVSLGNLGDHRAVEPLKRILDIGFWSEHAAILVVRALEQIGTPEALAAVQEWRKRRG